MNKNSVIPKYAGYIPHIQAQNQFGRRMTEVSRDCFNDKFVPQKPNIFATTGYAINKI